MPPFARIVGAAVLLAAVGVPGATESAIAADATLAPPVVSVIVATPRDLVAQAIVSGTLVPRHEVLVAPELDGVRVTEVLAEEGDRVVAGQVLARLSHDMLDVQLAQNAASLARSQAAIEQARSQIDQSAASAERSGLSLERAQALRRSGNTTEVALEQRTSASRSPTAGSPPRATASPWPKPISPLQGRSARNSIFARNAPR